MDHRQQSKDRLGLWALFTGLLHKHKAQLYQPLLLDVGFFFALGMVIGALGERLLEVLYALGAVIIRSSASALEAQDLYASLTPQAQSLGWQGAFLLVTILLAVYALYVCVHGMMWAVISSWVSPVDRRLYLKRFAQVNVLWGMGAVLLLAWAISIELMSRIGERLPEGPWWFAAGILLYLSSLSYALLGKNPALQALRISCRLALRPQILASALGAGIILFALDATIKFLGSSAISLAVALVAVFWIMVLLRLFGAVLVEVHHAR